METTVGMTAPAPTADRPVIDVQHIAGLIRDVPDWPTPGIIFKDIMPLLREPAAFDDVVQAFAAMGRDGEGQTDVDIVVGIEARGFILATPVAQALGVGFVPARKAGKLPGRTDAVTYELEYGSATVELQHDALHRGERVLVIDDVLATGGTLAATIELIERTGALVAGVGVLLDLGLPTVAPALHEHEMQVLLPSGRIDGRA